MVSSNYFNSIIIMFCALLYGIKYFNTTLTGDYTLAQSEPGSNGNEMGVSTFLTAQ